MPDMTRCRHFAWYSDGIVAQRAYRRLLAAPKGSFFLFGVRGVGKSTWTRGAFPDAHVVDPLDESRFHTLLANPGLLADEIRDLPRGRVVVLDEVQRVPALLNEVHRAIEGERRRFVLLGSSARRLKTANTNLLAGRATVRTMYPLVPYCTLKRWTTAPPPVMVFSSTSGALPSGKRTWNPPLGVR